jgi:hypothetical protein
MADDSGGKTPSSPRSVLSADEVRAFTDRAPRCRVSVAVMCTPGESGPAIEAELVNVSGSGMFVTSRKLFDIGTEVGFEFKLDDGVVALRGVAEVVRRELRGMGLRFVKLDEAGPELVARLVEVSAAHALPAPAGVEFGHGSIRVKLSPSTARFFTYNPLLHIGVGGCFLPADGTIPLGTGYELNVVDADDKLLLRCKAKVAATQDGRVGLRFIEVERERLQALRARVAALASSGS